MNTVPDRETQLITGFVTGRAAYGLILLLTVFVAAGCGIGESAPLLHDYPVYLWDQTSPTTLFVYHPTYQTVDSLTIPWQPTGGMSVSADGRRLYLPTGSAVVVTDSDSLGLVTELPFSSRGPVAVSPDNSLIAITGDSLRIVETDSWVVRACLPVSVRSAVFSDDSRILCCLGDSTDRDVVVVTLNPASEPVIERIRFAGGYPRDAVFALDGRRIIGYLEEQPMLHRLAVFDRLAGSEIYSEYIYPGEGVLATTTGWEQVVYTNPGSELRAPGASSFRIFDAQANELVAEVNTAGRSSQHCFTVSRVAVSPDRRWLVALNAASPELLLYDLRTRSVIRRQSFGGGSTPDRLSVQLIP